MACDSICAACSKSTFAAPLNASCVLTPVRNAGGKVTSRDSSMAFPAT